MMACYHDDPPSNLIENDVISMSSGSWSLVKVSMRASTSKQPRSRGEGVRSACVMHACDNGGRGFPWGAHTLTILSRIRGSYETFHVTCALSRSVRDNYYIGA